jgi:hypothetical protein
MTALMVAALYGKWDVVNLLLQRGANATLIDDVCFFLTSIRRERFIYFTKLTQQATEITE